MQAFLDLATEAIPRLHTVAPDPPTVEDVLLHVATHRVRITREGTERLMDALFAQHPILLTDPVIHQTALWSRLAPVATPAFAAYWTYIILPAWDHHAALHRLLRETAE